MKDSGAASFLAEGLVRGIGGMGPLALLAGLFLLSTGDPAYLANVRLQARQLAASADSAFFSPRR